MNKISEETDKLTSHEILKRACKYLLIIFIVALSTDCLTNNKLNYCEITMVSVIAGSIYAIVDMYSPSVSTQTIINVVKKN
jgi:hypothetical protein